MPTSHLHICTFSTLQVHKGKTYLKENVEIRGSERNFFKKIREDLNKKTAKKEGISIEKERGGRK